MATAEFSTDHIDSLPLVDLRLLSQSELHSISLSSSAGLPRRAEDDTVIPKIDRSVFNESAGSRKQTFSRLRLAPRNKQNSSVPAPSSSSFHIPLPIQEPVDEENSQIIARLQQLFGVESLRNGLNADAGDDRLVPVQVEFKQPSPESAALAFRNIPIDVVDSSQGKRKRGRPRKNEGLGMHMENSEAEKKAVVVVKEDKGFVVNGAGLEDVGDPFAEELIGRTQGLESETQFLEFLESLNGRWGSQRKKRRIVEANDLCNLLPTGWQVVLTLHKRAGRASVVCRRYISPDGHQFESYKDVSTYLHSLSGVQDVSHLKSSYTDGNQQFSSNINTASESQTVGYVPTGDMKTDANASCLASTHIYSHHEKQATISSSIGNTSDENFNIDLALGCKLGDNTSGTFRDFGYQTGDMPPLKADKNGANSVQDCSVVEDRVYNVRNEKLVDAKETSDAACNLYIPLVFTTPFSNSNDGIGQFSEEMNAVTCIKSGNTNFSSEDRNTGCYGTVPCGNEQAHVDNNGLGLSVRLVEEHIQKIGSESSMLTPNSEGKICAGNNLEDRHLINSLEDREISDGKPVKDDKQHIISTKDQSEIKDISTNVKLQSCLEGCSLVPSWNELKDTSTNSMDWTQTSMLKDSAEGKFFDNLPSSSIDKRTRVHSNNVSLSTCTKDASEAGRVDFTPKLEVVKDFSYNYVPPIEEVVTSCLQKRSSLNDQFTMDNLLDRSSEITGNQHPSAFHNNMKNISAGTFDAREAVDAGCMKPQFDIVSCSNVAADAYTSASIMQGISQGCVSVPLGGSILNRFDKQSDDGVNKANKSCSSEKAKSEVEIFQNDSMGMPQFR